MMVGMMMAYTACNPYLKAFAKQNCINDDYVDDDDDDDDDDGDPGDDDYDDDDDDDGLYWLELSDRHRSLTCLLPPSLIPGITPNYYTSSRIHSKLCHLFKYVLCVAFS